MQGAEKDDKNEDSQSAWMLTLCCISLVHQPWFIQVPQHLRFQDALDLPFSLALNIIEMIWVHCPSVMVWPLLLPFSSLFSFLSSLAPSFHSSPTPSNSEAYLCNHTMSTVRLALD